MQHTANTNISKPEQKRLAAIMFADMTGYTAMMQEDEARASHLRKRQRQTLDTFIPAHHGTIIQYFGDGTLSIFDSAADAVRSAVGIQMELQKEPAVKLRIGIHSGDVIYDKEGIYGDCVNIASRIESLSVPGAVLFSGKVFDEIKNQKDIQTRLLGKFHFKNVLRPMEVYAAANEGLVIPHPAEITGKLKTEKKNIFSLLKKGKATIIALASLVLISVVVVLKFQKSATAGTIDSIAVLPLENISSNPEQDFFVSGMHETLITELSKISSLKVISRTSTLQFKNTKKTMPQIAKELDVKALIEGSVIREGDSVRITVQLINGTTDKHIWAREFTQELKGIFVLYSDVAKQIASEIKITLTPEDQSRLVSAQPVNPRAYEFYLTGRHFWNQRTIAGYRQAIDIYNKALGEDSTYAPAYAALADCYIILGEQGGMARNEAKNLAASSINKALALNENLAEAHTSKGNWELYYKWDWAGSERAFKKAIELNPGFALAFQFYGRTLGFTGRYDEAIKYLAKAGELDPLSPVIPGYTAQVYLFAKNYTKAEEVLRQALKLHPNHPLLLHNLGELYVAAGRYKEAIPPLEQSTNASATFHYKAILALAYVKANRKEQAMAAFRDLLNSPPLTISEFHIAMIYVAMGNKEEAFNWLEKGYTQRDIWMKELKAWPWFDSLKDEPRYRNLLKRMNFPE